MRRVLAMVSTTALLLASGCGGRSYDKRLELTLENMRLMKRYDDNLVKEAPKGKFEQLLIYVRPPKTLDTKANEFTLQPVLEPGKFDLNESFYDKSKQSFLHVLARVKRPKNPAAKKAPPTAAETATRGEFNTDVIAILNSVYSIELDSAKAKEQEKGPRKNKFKHLTFEGNGKNVQVYFFGSKTSPYEVALIFEYPKSEQANLVSKIELCLGSFAVSERARKQFAGSVTEEDATEGAGAPVAF